MTPPRRGSGRSASSSPASPRARQPGAMRGSHEPSGGPKGTCGSLAVSILSGSQTLNRGWVAVSAAVERNLEFAIQVLGFRVFSKRLDIGKVFLTAGSAFVDDEVVAADK